jgi:hypothetical protein
MKFFYSGGDAFVAVVEPADLGDLHDPTHRGFGILAETKKGATE